LSKLPPVSKYALFIDAGSSAAQISLILAFINILFS